MEIAEEEHSSREDTRAKSRCWKKHAYCAHGVAQRQSCWNAMREKRDGKDVKVDVRTRSLRAFEPMKVSCFHYGIEGYLLLQEVTWPGLGFCRGTSEKFRLLEWLGSQQGGNRESVGRHQILGMIWRQWQHPERMDVGERSIEESRILDLSRCKNDQEG